VANETPEVTTKTKGPSKHNAGSVYMPCKCASPMQDNLSGEDYISISKFYEVLQAYKP
jgi:hypothetical protein